MKIKIKGFRKYKIESKKKKKMMSSRFKRGRNLKALKVFCVSKSVDNLMFDRMVKHYVDNIIVYGGRKFHGTRVVCWRLSRY